MKVQVPTKVHLQWDVSPALTRCGDLVAWRLHSDDIADVDCRRCLLRVAQEKARATAAPRKRPLPPTGPDGRWLLPGKR